VRQPGAIPAARTTDIMTSNYDLLPTVLDYLKLADKAPQKPPLPGRSYAAAMRGERLDDWENVVFYEFENVRAVRTDLWKHVERFPDGPHELYDLAADPGEQFNLFGQPRQAEMQASLRTKLHAFFDRYADPQYDLWHGGRAKTLLLSAPGKHGYEE
jgi:arylsulfatase A-like enzyme